MTTFVINGKRLPDDFTANTLSYNNGKKVNAITTNNHLTKEELKCKFNPNSAEGKKLKSHTRKSIYNKYGKTLPNDWTENYHYFICPVSGCEVVNFENNHFNRLGISKERFLELFPEYHECYVYPPAITLNRIETKNKSTVEKGRKKIEKLISVNGKTVDLNLLLKEPFEKSTKEYFKKHNIAYDESIEGYHYFKCPITERKLRILGDSYFKVLAKYDISKDDFLAEYPDIRTYESTPYSRGITLQDHLSGYTGYKSNTNTTLTRNHQKAKYDRETYSGNFDLRYNHLPLKELVTIIDSGNDATIVEYLKWSSTKNITLESISKELNKSVDVLEEFVDYFIHPFTGTYCLRITAKMISPFGISSDRFFKWFPEYAGATKSLIERIENVKSTVDESGLTPNQRASMKREITMKTVDPITNKTIQELSTEKMRNTKLNTLDKYGRNVYQVEASKNIGKSLLTRNIEAPKCRFIRYETIIDHVTQCIREFYRLQGYNLVPLNAETVKSTKDYQLDHRYSIAQGYADRISPLAIAHIRNVEPLTVKENSMKNNSCSITIQELSHITNYSINEMNDEFNKIMTIIDQDIIDGKYNITMDVLERAGSKIAEKMKAYYDFNKFVKECNYQLVNENLFEVAIDHVTQALNSTHTSTP